MDEDRTPFEERATVERALEGDKDALRTVIESSSRVVLREATRSLVRVRAMGGSAYSVGVEDLRQEVMALLFADSGRLLRAFDPRRGSLATYVASVARTRICNYLQRRGGTGTHEVSAEMDDLGTAPISPESRRVMSRLLEALRADLSDTLWQTFVEIFVNERSPKEAAQLLGTSSSAVHLRVWKIRRSARALLRGALGEHEMPHSASRDELIVWLRVLAQKTAEERS